MQKKKKNSKENYSAMLCNFIPRQIKFESY